MNYDSNPANELLKCSQSLVYFANNYIKIIHPSYGEMLFKARDNQNGLFRRFQNKENVVVKSTRVSGISTCQAIYALWLGVFRNNKNIILCSVKKSRAEDIIENVKEMYEKLPVWIKPAVNVYRNSEIGFKNGSKISVAPYSSHVLRGIESDSLVICDSFAFVDQKIEKEFWASTHLIQRLGQVIVSSSTNGANNKFFDLYTYSDDSVFSKFNISWDRIPGRDKKWKETMIKQMGQCCFDQEYSGKFI